MRILALTLLAAVLVEQAAAKTAIVVPNRYENAEAPNGTVGSSLFQNGYRVQTVFDVSQFASLPTSQQTMTGFLMRPDGFLGSAKATTWPNYILRMSTTEATLATLSNEYAENTGQDELVVYEGQITLSTANEGPAGGPKTFDIAFDFQTRFHYDPSKGNLLMDWYVVGPAGWVGDDRDDSITGVSASVSSTDRDAALGTIDRTGTAVFQFVFVPEPSTCGMLLLGMMAVLWRRRAVAASP